MIALRKGDVIDNKYRILKIIAPGGQSTVYEAENLADIKQYNDLPEDCQDEQKAVYREINRRGSEWQKSHNLPYNPVDNLCLPVSDPQCTGDSYEPEIGVVNKGIYAVFPFLKGDTLKALLENHALDKFQTRRLLRAICRICRWLEMNGVAHLDIKPDNFIVTNPKSAKPYIKLIDMDYARIRDASNPNDTYVGIRPLGGTEFYRAPEVARDDVSSVSSRSDAFSLGMLIVDMLMDGEVFRDSLEEKNLLQGKYRLPQNDLHPEVVKYIKRAFSIDPKGRPSISNLTYIINQYAGTFFRKMRCQIAISDQSGKTYYFEESQDISEDALNPIIRLPKEACLHLDIDQEKGDYSVTYLQDEQNFYFNDRPVPKGKKRFLEIPDPNVSNSYSSEYRLYTVPIKIYLEED